MDASFDELLAQELFMDEVARFDPGSPALARAREKFARDLDAMSLNDRVAYARYRAEKIN